jgi:hypothetical protein
MRASLQALREESWEKYKNGTAISSTAVVIV